MAQKPIRCRILIVDSSLEMLSLMSNLFRPYGFDLIVTSSADDAVSQAIQFQPHAVYMGLEYQDCDGWELVGRLRRVPGMKRTMFVGLIDRRKGWQSEDEKGSYGFDYYFPKPPRMRDIVAAMTDMINR
jgi:DNA-binding response OmpR family regulator